MAALLEGRQVKFETYVVDELGMDDGGRPIPIIFGALAMQKWDIRPVPDEERLDFTHFSEEFTEFCRLRCPLSPSGLQRGHAEALAEAESSGVPRRSLWA